MDASENLYLGLPYEDSGESIAAEYLSRRVEEYPPGGCISNDVLMATLAVDVQANRLEYEFRGWGKGEESWGLKYGVIPGDPAELTSNDISNPSVWQRLDEIRQQSFIREDGIELRACCTIIDSGYLTDTVYAYARPRERLRVYATKGSNQATTPIMNKPNRNTKNRCLLYKVGVDKAKELTYSRLRLEEPGPGYMHFPADETQGYDPAYYAGLTCERRMVKHVRGFARLEWHKPKDAANEPLDLAVLGLAAIRQDERKWDIIAARYEKYKPGAPKPVVKPHIFPEAYESRDGIFLTV